MILIDQVMGFGLFLLDSETVSINKLDQKKKIRLEKLDRVIIKKNYVARRVKNRGMIGKILELMIFLIIF